MEVETPTEEEIRWLGWNSPEHDNPTLTARIIASQLCQQNLLLLAILERLKELDADG